MNNILKVEVEETSENKDFRDTTRTCGELGQGEHLTGPSSMCVKGVKY